MSANRTHNDKDKSSYQIIETDPDSQVAEVTLAGISHYPSLTNQEEIESRSIWRGLKAQTTAILVGAAAMLPILTLGTVTYYFTSETIANQAIFARRLENRELSEAELARREKLLAALLIGTGTTALLVGALATWGTTRLLNDSSPISTEEPETGIETQGSNLLSRVPQKALPTQLLNNFTLAIRDLARGEALRDRLNESELLNLTVEKARQLMELDRVVIYQFDADGNGIIAAESVEEGYPKALSFQVQDPCLTREYAEKYRQGRIQVINNIEETNLAGCYRKQLAAFAIQASLVVPILRDGQLFGLFMGHQCSQPRSWKQSSIDLFAQLALQLGLALERVKLKEELSLIQNIQNHEAHQQQLRKQSDQSLSIQDLSKKFEQTTASFTDNTTAQKQLGEGEISEQSQNTQQNQNFIANSVETAKKIELLNQSHQNISQMVGLIDDMKEKIEHNRT